jgi:C4-dicarboxylate-specific signal transduction histidine kinase
LIKNAIESLINKENPILTIGCQKTIDGEMKTEVGDNGPEISPELLDKFFVPFFQQSLKVQA